ncbi:MAG: hypothetical protein ACI4KF_07970 [Huintestinicola sp.]
MNEKFHYIKVEVKNLYKRAEEADTVSELCDISYELGKLVQNAYSLYALNQLNNAAYHSIITDTNNLMDFILAKEAT